MRLELDTLSVSFDNVGLKETLKWGSGLTESLWYTGNGLLEFSLFNSALADSAFRREYDRDSIGRIAKCGHPRPQPVVSGRTLAVPILCQTRLQPRCVRPDIDGQHAVRKFLFRVAHGERCASQEAAFQSLGYDRASNFALRDSSSSQGFRVDSATYAVGNRLTSATWLGLTYESDSDGNIRRKTGATTDIPVRL